MAKVLAWACLLALSTMAPVLQAQDSACLNKLVPCLQYINSKKTPSSSCCDPLRSLVQSDPQCLCSMLGSGSAKQAGVNTTQAQQLPARCGEKVNAAMCSKHKTKNKVHTSRAEFPTANGLIICVLYLIVQFVWSPIS